MRVLKTQGHNFYSWIMKPTIFRFEKNLLDYLGMQTGVFTWDVNEGFLGYNLTAYTRSNSVNIIRVNKVPDHNVLW